MKTKLLLLCALALCVIALVACTAPTPTATPVPPTPTAIPPTSTLTSVPPTLTPPAATSPTLDPFRGVAPSATQASFANVASFRKLPYLLYAGNNTSMIVMWQTNGTPTARIEWGDTEAYQGGQANVVENKSGADEHQFAYTIGGQKPGTRIFYRVTVDGKTSASSFVMPPPRDAESLTFYAYGDTRTTPVMHNIVLSGLLRDVNKNPATRQTILLHVGDYVTFGLSETNWDREYFYPSLESLSSVLASMPMIGALGNHEEYPEGLPVRVVCPRAGELFRKYFPYLMYVDPRHFYYSFDYGPVHVAVIDPYTSDYTKETGAQYKWLKQDLSQPRPFKIVMMHPPAWSNDASGFALRQNLHELFKASGVGLVLQGHQHYYSRFMVDGIPYLTVGGGGAPLSTPSVFNPDAYDEKRNTVSYACVEIPFIGDPKLPVVNLVDSQKAAREYHFARIEIASGKMTVTVINAEGKVIDCIPDDATCTP